jgi:hypothetical protein
MAKKATKKQAAGSTKKTPVVKTPSRQTQDGSTAGFEAQPVPISDLKPHPRNYRTHPRDQISHLIQSIREHGIYRNVVVARDNTILAGHGVVQAATEMGWTMIPAIKLPVDPESTQALKVLAGDNGLGHLAENDDRMFTEILKQIRDEDTFGLIGTGYDDQMLAGLLFVTRPESEIKDIDEASQWVGMPDYEDGETKLKIVISFRNEQDRKRFAETHGLKIGKKEQASWMTWWPFKERDDLSSVRFEASA